MGARKWSLTHEGHEVRVENFWRWDGQTSESLYIDSVLADRSESNAFHKGQPIRLSAELHGTFRNQQGTQSEVRARLSPGFAGLTVKCQIWIDGRRYKPKPLKSPAPSDRLHTAMPTAKDVVDDAKLPFEQNELSTPNSMALTCSVCQQPIIGPYYQVNANTSCPNCLENLRKAWSDGSAVRRVGRAVGLGVGAAALGSGLWFAIVAFTGYEFGLVAVVVGWMVGWAVKRGSDGRGGRFYQFAAVALTYAAIVSTYIPAIIQSAVRQAEEKKVADATTNSPSFLPTTNQAPLTRIPARGNSSDHPPTPPSVLVLAKDLLILFAFACAVPFLAGFQNVLGLLIISFALFEAWRLTKRVEMKITGPFEAAAGPASSPAARTGPAL